jgi:hypothetical protein
MSPRLPPDHQTGSHIQVTQCSKTNFKTLRTSTQTPATPGNGTPRHPLPQRYPLQRQQQQRTLDTAQPPPRPHCEERTQPRCTTATLAATAKIPHSQAQPPKVRTQLHRSSPRVIMRLTRTYPSPGTQPRLLPFLPLLPRQRRHLLPMVAM